MENREIKNMIAIGYMREEQITDIVDELAESIARTFSSLANLSPDAALYVLGELNSQLTHEEVDLVLKSRSDKLESIMDCIDLGELLE
jgi:undecaprenyl pyrophosphate synthase